MNLIIELREDNGDFLGSVESAVKAEELMALPRLVKQVLEPAAVQLRGFYETAVAFDVSRRLQSVAGVPHTEKQMN